MRKLNYELKELCIHNKEGSFSTRTARHYTLNQAANDLHELGFRNLGKHGLRPKHVDALIEKWKSNGVSDGTLKNRMTHIRWWASHINKSGMIPKSNKELGVDRRVYVTNKNKGQPLDGRVEVIRNPMVQMSVRLQAAFGMRREESIKFQPSESDRGDRLYIKKGTKGGKPRSIPIKTVEQRALVDACRKLVGNNALIPISKDYKYQKKLYENDIAKAGFHKLHGLRHHYAQERYEKITGWKSPVQGGPKRASLSSEDKQLDNTARQIISRELGHERLEVVSVYIGV
ncbi:MAG: phage integrase N-terminal domain-containing protein [Pseudomonadota bacterium]